MPFRRPRAVLAALWCVAFAAAPAAAQGRAYQLTTDNDAFDFWIPAVVRPDYEYSSGVRVAVESEGARAWAGLARAVAPCAKDVIRPVDEAPCASTVVEAGQRMYVPRVDSFEPLAGQRPFAGWLYGSVTGRVMDGRTRHSFGIEAGITGKPSLGQSVMEGYHQLLGFWKPVGWSHQLAFEPAASVTYGVEHRVAEARVGGVRMADLTADAGASLGTLRTSARAGAELRAGTRLAHPWRTRPGRGTSVYVRVGVRGEAVAHDLFLDGNTFDSDAARVTRRPFVGQTRWGVGIAHGPASIEYRVTARTRAYGEEPGGHPYGTIEVTWRRGPRAPAQAAKPAAPSAVSFATPSIPSTTKTP
ncbi:lipid A deacylase LpxR family protein [Longimicrobium sp.]|uniref:lipid A deacylase LpxR family protein n=1 Tax=Longimicrobium sp. TaxID=2029185 RepID=UPI002E308939|nr:lipid A deacylase LpxR family protein [Longimicrobium sp.]HEX6040615.1 lipid A deacylase LpxR family protein [Longimicrobium sp.]